MIRLKFLVKLLTGLLLTSVTLIVNASPGMAQSIQDDYALAAGYYSRGEWDQAAIAFDELLRTHPNTEQSTLARFFAAEVMMQRGQFSKGFLAFQSFLKNHPHHKYAPRATFRMGEAAYRIDQYDIAVRMLEEFVKKNPYHELNEFALPYLGEIRFKREEPQLSKRAFETALKMYPAGRLSNNCRLGLAKALQVEGLDLEAERFYQFLLTQPDLELANEAQLQLGIMSFGRDDLQSAEIHLTEALQESPSARAQAEASYWLARTQIELTNYERAIELIRTIPDQEVPEKLAVSALFDGAIAAHKSGNDALAFQWLKELRQTFPDNMMVDDALRMEIDIRQQLGETTETLSLIREFRRGHESSPMRAGVLEAEGRSHYSEKRFEQAIESFDLLLAEHGNDADIQPSDRANWLYLKSLGHLGLGDFDGAIGALSQINSRTPTDPLKPLLEIAWATARFGKQNYVKAIENYRSYLSLLPDGPDSKRARTELTICLAELGRWDECAQAFDDLGQRHPADSKLLSIAQYLAEKAYQEKQVPFAERWFELLSEPGNSQEMVARGLSGLAWIKMETADASSAYHVFERLLTECPDSKFSGEAAMARAKYLEDQRQFDKAAQMYGLVIRRFGKSPMANVAKLRRAYSLQKIGGRVNLEESKTLLEDYLNQPSNKPLADEALYQLAWLLQDLGSPELGREKFGELVQSLPGSKYWSDAAYRLAKHAVEKGDLARAEQLLSQIVARTDAPIEVSTRSLFLQGQVAAGKQQWTAVTTSMSQLIGTTDDRALETKAQYWLAESLYRQKNYDEAVTLFAELVPKVDQLDRKLEPWILLRAAQCYGYQNDWNEAEKLAELGKDRFPDFVADYEFDFVLGRIWKTKAISPTPETSTKASSIPLTVLRRKRPQSLNGEWVKRISIRNSTSMLSSPITRFIPCLRIHSGKAPL